LIGSAFSYFTGNCFPVKRKTLCEDTQQVVFSFTPDLISYG
jgi:hypothetical protein